MSKKSSCWGWYLGLGMMIASAYVGWAKCAIAQISPDGTLPNNSTININGNIFDITGGTRAGNNLFHSFRDFSVLNGSEAHFNNAVDINNIISRVTGSSVSNIDGLIKVLQGNANLFLLNPNGIIFGQNARLDIRGSFVASTANSIKFADGFEFSAKNAQTTPLLTISVPLGLQFGANPQRIQVQGDGQGVRGTDILEDTQNALRVQPNQTLALVGGDVSLEGATLKTAGGRIELGSVAGEGLVTLTPINKGFSLGYAAGQNFGNIQLSQKAVVDASGAGGGDVQVTGRRVSLKGGSQIEASTLGSQAGGTLGLNASELLEVSGSGSGLFVDVYSRATGAGGNLTINTPVLQVKDGAIVSASTYGAGNGGNLTINTPVLQVKDGAIVSASTYGAGNGGDLTINTGTLQVENGSQVRASTFGAGRGGNLSVIADSVKLSDSYLSAQVRQNATGNAGDLTIKTGTLLVENGAQVSAGTFGAGNGGKLTVDASKKVEVIGTSADGEVSSGLFTQQNTEGATGAAGDLTINTPVLQVQNGALVSARTFGAGNGGDLTIKTGTLQVENGAQVSADTYGAGKGGNLTVNASEKVEVTGTSANGRRASLSTDTDSKSKEATAGNLTIYTPVLQVRDGAIVSASTDGAGNGGNLTVNASEKVEVTGTIPNGQSGSRLAANTSGTGNAGNLTINTGRLVVKDSQVGTTTFGQGNAGILTVKASEIDLSGVLFGETDDYPAGLFAQVNSQGTGSGGKLNIETGRLSISNGAKVQVATFGQGDAGDLFIRASEIDIFETPRARYTYFAGGIYAGVQTTRDAQQAPKGYGGSVEIVTNRLTVRDGGTVTTSTEGQGDAGTLKIRATEYVEVFGRSPGDLFNSEISAATTPLSTGNGGLLSIDTGKLIVRDRGIVTVRNERKDGTSQAGNLEINARSINLDNGSLTATTKSGNGGNMFLTVKDLLLLRNQSTISATAGTAQQGGDGGNINIQAPNGFVVAVPNENSDITANAFSGSGGRITINTTARFGLVLRSGTDIARLLGTTEATQLDSGRLQTNDITAFSQQNPDVSQSVRTVETDFNFELVELPTVVVDTSNLIDTSCGALANGEGNQFTVTGRGGLPPSPYEPLSTDVVWSDTRLPATTARQDREQTPSAKPTSKPEAVAILPATGWVFNDKGDKVTLISHASSAASLGSTAASCPQR
ncbi:filamentous hemagglutinin N-terminal domain-containing protein [Scytonema sp. PCC 10023]|uniref:two-partner secretion domain-containing protein n=1 Tax=Scytonema sp. PCC 10023 TaxID=1680591 RepID=UPI0039C7169A